jgi:hypothetical protein
LAASLFAICAVLLSLAACSKLNIQEDAPGEFGGKAKSVSPSQIVAEERSIWPHVRRSYELHAKLTEKEIACGLASDPLDYNDTNSPELDISILECLEAIESHRAGWKAFLYSVHQFETNAGPCVAREALSISFRSRPFAIISSYKITEEEVPPRVDLLIARAPFLTLDRAKDHFLDQRPGFSKRYVNYMRLCKTADTDRASVLSVAIIENFLNIEERQ